MSTELTRRLPELAVEITREHELCEASYRTALAHAVRVGELLIEAKAQLGHGDWLPWVAEHTPVAARTAQQYMQLAGLPNAHSNTHLPLVDVVRAATPKARTDELRTALKINPAEAEAALAELGEMPTEQSPFPSSAMERETWRQIGDAQRRVARAMDEATARGLSTWSRREALHEAARHARAVASQLAELADALGA